MPELKFLPNDAGEGEGLSDAGIEWYRDDPFPAVARETSQNSRDAHDKELCSDKPVILEIDKIDIPATSLPDYKQFREVAEGCFEHARKNKRKKEQAFFEQARKVLNSEKISVLRISDFNTKGLRGPCEEGSPFHSLVKSSGVSNKEEDTSGGSFGIGKSAVYSASDLQTVFYSTHYIDDSGQAQFLCQGKTKFTSFTDKLGDQFRSVGYWGEPKGYLPVARVSLAPEWLKRDTTGTTVCSVAVRESDAWQAEIASSLLMNFFSAIHNNQMEFKVGGKVLKSQTLRGWFEDEAIQRVVKKGNKEEDYAFSQYMFECLTNNDEAHEYRIEISGVGRFRLRVLVKDGLPKRVGILRNGMYICDSLVHFGDKFSRFPMYRDFVAIVEPEDDNASVWLKQMENPRHDEFSPQRLLTPAERQAAANAGKDLATRIREKIKEEAKPESKDETDLDELSEFFALDNKGKKDERGPRNIETFVVQTRPPKTRIRRTKSPASEKDGDEGGGQDKHENGGSGENKGGTGSGSGTGGKGKQSSKNPFVLLDTRTLLPDPTDLNRRTVLFTPAKSGTAVLQFQCSGLSNPEILSTIPGECRVSCNSNQRQALEVRFVTGYDGPIEIVSWSAEEGAHEAQ